MLSSAILSNSISFSSDVIEFIFALLVSSYSSNDSSFSIDLDEFECELLFPTRFYERASLFSS